MTVRYPETARSYVEHPAVFAIDARWMVDRAHLAPGRFDLIAEASCAAMTLVGPDLAEADVSA